MAAARRGERSSNGILELVEQGTHCVFPSARTAGERELKVRLSCRLQELYLLHEIELAGGARAAWGRRVRRRRRGLGTRVAPARSALSRRAASSTAVAALLAGDCAQRLPPATASATLVALPPSQQLHAAAAAAPRRRPRRSSMPTPQPQPSQQLHTAAAADSQEGEKHNRARRERERQYGLGPYYFVG
uniref:Uncharacterized protein n=1 Tax=Oryza meridionalis TaxID=40149 RepID=A0A0E0EG37_9ORYZ